MNPHHAHIYRARHESDKVIADYGVKPSDVARQKTKENILQERENFVRRERIRQQVVQRSAEQNNEHEI